jgi:acetyltransferase-like isoleucine patch superfamily enzyme
MHGTIKRSLRRGWARFWMGHSGSGAFGRLATRLASWRVEPYKGRIALARLSPRGYVSPSARLSRSQLSLGKNVFIDDGVVVFQNGGGAVQIGDRVLLCRDVIVEIGPGGGLTIGPDTGIQARCVLTAYEAPIRIGRGVQIAPHCAFFSYDHGIAPGELISRQPLTTRGPIVVDDDAWLGTGATVLSGVRIGKGAVVGAGSLVTRDVPEGAVAIGSPARVVKMRSELDGATELMLPEAIRR